MLIHIKVRKLDSGQVRHVDTLRDDVLQSAAGLWAYIQNSGCHRLQAWAHMSLEYSLRLGKDPLEPQETLNIVPYTLFHTDQLQH